MFSTMNYNKLKTNLRLSVNRLKLIGKKKTELTQKSRREIADFIAAGKEDRARIKVEQIVREDYYVEAFELLEMFCDLLLARFGLIEQMKTIDKGLEEAINSLLWAAPRLQTEIPELKIISDQITFKYGKPYAEACRENKFEKVNEKLLHKLSVLTPPKVLVEKYMVEIAKSHNVPFVPDASVVMSEQAADAEALLIDYQQQNKVAPEGFNAGSGGFQPPARPLPDYDVPSGAFGPGRAPGPSNFGHQPFNYPNLMPNAPGASLYDKVGGASVDEKHGDPTAAMPPPIERPPPPPYTTLPPPPSAPPSFDGIDSAPPASTTTRGVDKKAPSSSSKNTGGKQEEDDDEFDFDDLNRRFEELKKRR